MTVIIDYGMGNLASVYNAFIKVGETDVRITSTPSEVEKADRVILPGVGAFEDAMKVLNKSGMSKAIRNFVESGRPFLGICLGFQLIFDRSFENGEWEGLGILPGDVRRFEISEPVPHMGWNQTRFTGCNGIYSELNNQEYYYYFDHAYYAVPGDKSIVSGLTEYGGFEFCSVAGRQNVFATQFHPEKSHDQGLDLIRRFCGIVNKG